MQKFLKTDIFIVLLIFLIFISILPFFFLHQGLLTVDTGREFYISQQVSNGGVLYKDIFNIYGPFSYQFNALLFFIFGQSINTLYIAGIINSFIILTAIYLLAREFLNKSFSFMITVLTMFSLVFSTFLFNSNMTYSFGLMYALSALLLSILFLIKYIESAKVNFVYLSCLFAGLSILNKYEFILYPILLIYTFGFIKPIGIKNAIKAVVCFISIPLISFSILFFQGLTIEDIQTALNLMTIMAQSESMKLFYSIHGCFFEPAYYLKLILNNPLYTVLGFLPVINIILFLVFIKKIYKNKVLFVFCIASILAAIKFTLFLEINHMGAFLFPLCFLTAFILSDKFSNIIRYLLLTCLILFFAYSDFDSLRLKTHLLETPKGNIYTYYKDKMMMQIPIDYITENSESNDKVLVVPEGAFINFATDRKSDNTYHNLVPLYYKDTFGEKEVLKHFETENIMKYIIILPLPTDAYGSPDFCSYAHNFCEMINTKYNLVKEEKNIKIFERK